MELQFVLSDFGIEILWLIFLVIMTIFVVMTWIFSYHWKSYGVEGSVRTFAVTSYWMVAIGLLLVMFISLTSFSLGL